MTKIYIHTATYRKYHFLDSSFVYSLVPEKQSQDVFVVAEFDVSPVDAFLIVDRLLRRQDERVEEVLKLLVRDVDTQLLEAIVCQVLEARQVEDADGESVQLSAKIDGDNAVYATVDGDNAVAATVDGGDAVSATVD